MNTPISSPREQELDEIIRIGRLGWASCWRRKGMIAAIMLVTIGIAATYITWRGDAYTAKSRILVDNRVLALAQQDAIYSVSSLSSQLLQSQVEILRAESIARRVIEQLGLLKYADFGAGDAGAAALLPPASNAPSTDTRPANAHAMRRALDSFQKRLSVEQVGQTYVIEVRMTSSDPERAANIVNDVVATYLREQTTANESAAESASGWLRDRMRSLGTTARILSMATPPVERDGPRAAMILGFAGFCGLMLGGALAFGSDLFDRKLRTRKAIQLSSGAECFGSLPIMQRPSALLGLWRTPKALPRKANGHLLAEDASLNWAAERPNSLFTHNLRRTCTVLLTDRSSSCLLVGVTSALPREGKTVIAANLGRVAAHWGKRVLLIDAAPYNSQLTKLLASQAEHGLLDVLGGMALDDIVLRDQWLNLHFIPGVNTGDGEATEAGLIASALERTLPQIKSQYDLVLIDMPPLAPMSDALELAHLLDRVLLVVEWGRYTGEELASALKGSGLLHCKVIGTILNKVNLRKLQSYADEPELGSRRDFAEYINDKERRRPARAAAAVRQDEARPASTRNAGRADVLLRPLDRMDLQNTALREGSEGNA